MNINLGKFFIGAVERLCLCLVIAEFSNVLIPVSRMGEYWSNVTGTVILLFCFLGAIKDAIN